MTGAAIGWAEQQQQEKPVAVLADRREAATPARRAVNPRVRASRPSSLGKGTNTPAPTPTPTRNRRRTVDTADPTGLQPCRRVVPGVAGAVSLFEVGEQKSGLSIAVEQPRRRRYHGPACGGQVHAASWEGCGLSSRSGGRLGRTAPYRCSERTRSRRCVDTSLRGASTGWAPARACPPR